MARQEDGLMISGQGQNSCPIGASARCRVSTSTWGGAGGVQNRAVLAFGVRSGILSIQLCKAKFFSAPSAEPTPNVEVGLHVSTPQEVSPHHPHREAKESRRTRSARTGHARRQVVEARRCEARREEGRDLDRGRGEVVEGGGAVGEGREGKEGVQ